MTTYIVPAPSTPPARYTTAELPTSAHRETVWARALRDGMVRHGRTPLYDALVAEYAADVLLEGGGDV